MGGIVTSITRCKASRLFIIGIAAALLGCGGGNDGVTISGTVSVNGKPLQNGKIMVRPLGSAVGSGGSAEVVDGNYQLQDVPLGSNAFTFSGSALTGKSIAGPGGAPEPERVNAIPRQILQEGVEREVPEAGTQDFSLEGPV